MNEEEYKKKMREVHARLMVSVKKAAKAMDKFSSAQAGFITAMIKLEKSLDRPSVKLAFEIDEFYREAVKANFPAQFRRMI